MNPSDPPGPPVTVDDFEALAREVLPPMVFDYYAGGASDERTLRGNREAFDRWVLRPRVLVDVSERSLATTVLGSEVAFPVLASPTALQRMAHPDGEVAAALACRRAGTVFALSSLASSTIEEVAETGAARWFQLYVYRDRDVTADLVKRAEAAGYSALLLTVDVPVLGIRDRDTRNRFTTPPGVTLANLAGLGVTELPEDAEGSALFRLVAELQDPTVTWEDVAWLRSLTPTPVALKGIVTAEDARLAVDAGVDGIVVSNHGGRQLDGTVATLDALPEVVDAVEGRCEVLVDGGVRRGSDVLKALALGAKAVMVGRPLLWGLAVDGEDGASRVLEILRAELDNALAIAGCTGVESIPRSLVGGSGG